MTRLTDKCFVVVFILMLLLPAAQMRFGFIKVEKLHGVERSETAVTPEFSLELFLTERFQRSLETWWEEHLGFRGHFVRSDNQLNFTLFREISANYASPLIVGKRNSLFEKLYVDHANGKDVVPDRKLKSLSRRVARTQALLKERGIYFLLLISPSKATVYREDIPDRYIRHAQQSAPSNYDRFVPMLKEAGVNILDGRELLMKWKSTERYPVFPKGGTHWTQLTACKVANQILLSYSSETGESVSLPRCEPTEEKLIPEPFDRDLADLANLWKPARIYERLGYPPVPNERITAAASAPRALFIGGSFLWSLFVYLDAYGSFSERSMLYYYSRRFEFPSGSVSEIKREAIDWENDIFQQDLIIVEVNEITIPTLGSGFIEDAVTELKRGRGGAPQEEPHDPTEVPIPPSRELGQTPR